MSGFLPPTPTWTTLSGDMTVGATGTTTVASSTGSFTIHGNVFNDGYSGAITTDGSVYTIYTDTSVGASSVNDYIISVVGLDSADGYCYRCDFSFTYQRIGSAAPTAVGATPVPLNVRASAGASGWGGAAIALSTNSVTVTVQGAVSRTIHWSLSLNRTAVT